MPSFAFDPSLDRSVIDGLQTVSYYVRTGESLPNPLTPLVTVNNALRVDVTLMEQTALGLLGKETTTFYLWKADLGTVSPKIGDIIVDGGGLKWEVVNKDDFERLTGKYELTCLKLK